VVDYVAEDPLIKAMNVNRDQVATALAEVGFTDDLRVRGSEGHNA
jgi:acetylglutamate kinase